MFKVIMTMIVIIVVDMWMGMFMFMLMFVGKSKGMRYRMVFVGEGIKPAVISTLYAVSEVNIGLDV